MDEMFCIGLTNAAWAAGLALLAAAGSRLFKHRPALAHTLWLLVLIKLITPSAWNITYPCAFPPRRTSQPASYPLHHHKRPSCPRWKVCTPRPLPSAQPTRGPNHPFHLAAPKPRLRPLTPEGTRNPGDGKRTSLWPG